MPGDDIPREMQSLLPPSPKTVEVKPVTTAVPGTTSSAPLPSLGDGPHLAPVGPALPPPAAMLRLSLRRNFSWTLAGSLVYAACQWAILVLLARMGTPAVVGLYTFAIAVVQPVMTFSQMHLRTVQATDGSQDYPFSHYFTLRLFTTTIATLIVAGIAVGGDYGREAVWLILIIGMWAAVDSISDICYGLQQQSQRMDSIARSIGAKGVLSVTGVAVGLWLTNSVLGSAVGMLAASSAVLLAYDWPVTATLLRHQAIGSRVRPQISRRQGIAALVRIGGSLGFTSLFVLLSSNSSRYFIVYHFGEASLGLFAVVASLAGLGRTVLAPLSQAVVPRMASLYAVGCRTEYLGLMWKLLALSALMGVGTFAAGLFAGESFLQFLYGPEYAECWEILLWLLAASTLNYMGIAAASALTSQRRFAIQMYVSAVVCAVTVAAGWVLVPSDGLRGAALAILLGGAAQLLIYGIALRRAMLKFPRGAQSALQ